MGIMALELDFFFFFSPVWLSACIQEEQLIDQELRKLEMNYPKMISRNVVNCISVM